MNTENNYIETDLGNVSPSPCGEYDPSAQYEYLDLVSYQGGSYLCLIELGTKVSGTAPEAGKNTDIWQLVTLPGNLTPEYVAMHDDVANKAKQVESSRAAVEQSQQNVEAAQTDVQQLHSNTTEAAQEASDSRDSAAGYASAAEQSRKATKESEENVTAQVTGFDSHVTEKTLEAVQSVESARQTAVDTVIAQQNKSVQEVKSDIQTTGETAMSNLQAEATKQQEYIKTSIDDTLSISGKAADAAVTGKKMDSLKEDISNKITKFYASNQGETHITDSDNGKIQDMMLYGKSEQNQYKGINLLPTGISYNEIIEVSIPKGTHIFWATDGTPALGGNFKFYNEDKTQDTWFGIDVGKTAMTRTIDIDAKYMKFLIGKSQSVKICLGIGDNPVYEPYTGGQPSPSPDYPQEIKSVVNPTVKVVSANIMQLNDVGEVVVDGITVSCKDGVIKAKGTVLKDYTIPLGGSAEFIVMKSMTLQNSKTYIFNPNPIKQTESSECYLDFTNANNLGISLSNNNINNPIKPTDSQTQYPFNLNIIVKQGTVVDAEWKPQLLLNESLLPYKPYTEQSVTLPITLNAIPVESGGNVTIDGQQYIADRVVEKDGVFGIERNIREIHTNTKTMNNTEEYPGWNKVEGISDVAYYNEQSTGASKMLTFISNFTQTTLRQNNIEPNNIVFLIKDLVGYSQSDLIAKAIDVDMYIRLQNAIFEPLPVDMQAKLRTLVANHPVTNISVNSEQLDGYTVFNYPISMANGWNYVKQQLNDNRDYIYDMDEQSAEAYVNSEYAVALTELEV